MEAAADALRPAAAALEAALAAALEAAAAREADELRAAAAAREAALEAALEADLAAAAAAEAPRAAALFSNTLLQTSHYPQTRKLPHWCVKVLVYQNLERKLRWLHWEIKT